MGNEAMPEYIADQGMYYSAAAPNFHGYYCTGLESPCESDGHQRFFGLDGQDLHYLGMQTEGLPYVYYTPSYESAHSNYNHYSSCNIPSAVVGADSQFVGTQQYFTNATYQQPVSSPAFFPVVLQPGASFSANVAPEPFIYNPVASGAGENSGISVKSTPPAPVGLDSSVYLSDSVTRRSELCQMPSKQLHLSSNVQKGFQFDFKNVKQRASNETMASNGVSLVSQLQARDSTGSVQVSDQLKGNVPSVRSSLKVTAKAFNGSGQLGPHVLARASVDRVRPSLQSGIQNNATVSPAILGDQSKGPRMDRSKGPWTPFVVKAYTTKAGACNAQGNITIYPDQYNRGDFPVNYPDAKFFVIKSYSEDDVHKSIKYSVWSSTPSGNKRLDGAYEEVQRISGGKTGTCPVFLFFSVNGSGQFCGVAEMIGPVDFSRDMDFWQQDKWAGSFPVKWHIIKDVPNASFRHIILENNENKPVTNSRDTQQVKYMPGVNMLSIFKNSPLRASILDDFSYYEDRQKIMFEEKSRLFFRTCGTTMFLPAFAPNKSSVTVKHPLKTQEKAAEPEGNTRTSDVAVSVDDKITSRLLQNGEVSDKKSGTLGVAQDGSIDSVMKIGSLSVDLREGETDRQAASTVTAGTVEYVTVGSVPIKVDGSGASSSGDSTVGAIPTHPKAGKQKRLNGVSASSKNTPVQEKAALQTT